MKITFFACFGFCNVRAHTQANVAHPSAPADGNRIALLPITDNRPPKTIVVNRNPFAYFYLSHTRNNQRINKHNNKQHIRCVKYRKHSSFHSITSLFNFFLLFEHRNPILWFSNLNLYANCELMKL